ncbi:phosphomevalonate kinase, peroxisomal [Tanacetum coccineum]|uniref:phosphomevalonate kinase n=1 Tax=Tanacetum coccineum TaxID=301880 RepID=A0ABQ5BH16_9ASTR
MTAAVIASAPGKVLITGGYLVLERPNAGIVLSTNARFYAIVKPLYDELRPDSWLWVRIFSFYFSGFLVLDGSEVNFSSDGPRNYVQNVAKALHSSVHFEASIILHILPLEVEFRNHITCSYEFLTAFGLCFFSESRNPFVEYAVQYAIAAAYATLGNDKKDLLQKLLLHGFDITILGGNDFYSYRNEIEARGLPLTPESLASLPPFTSITFNSGHSNGANSKPEVAKTGLGSSAAMTTAVVAALLNYLGVVNLSSYSGAQHQENLDVVHIIAQTAHCMAQGKVGSGFDVSSAVYGSHRYVRFSPEVISSAQNAIRALPLEDVVGDVLKGKWDHERTKFSLPPLMNLLLGEPGTGGSSTPSMVGAVKNWQKSDPQKSLDTWRQLSVANTALEHQLNLLSKLAEEHWDTYNGVIYSCSMHQSEKWIEQASEAISLEIVKALHGARDAMLNIRCHMREMGKAAGIPIEPESQTQLLDATMSMPGVLLAGVPGAGGFDAVFAVTLGESGNNLINAWSSHKVLALLVREDPRGVSLENADPRTNQITSGISSVRIV